jgi:hypothetical protein
MLADTCRGLGQRPAVLRDPRIALDRQRLPQVLGRRDPLAERLLGQGNLSQSPGTVARLVRLLEQAQRACIVALSTPLDALTNQVVGIPRPHLSGGNENCKSTNEYTKPHGCLLPAHDAIARWPALLSRTKALRAPICRRLLSFQRTESRIAGRSRPLVTGGS